MKKRSLEKLLKQTREMIDTLLKENHDALEITDYGRGIKAGEEIALNCLLDYMNRSEEHLKENERWHLDDILVG